MVGKPKSRKPSSRKPAKPTPAGAGAQWQRTFDAITDALCLVDPRGAIHRCNKAFAAFVGRGPDAVVGEDCCALIHGGADHPPGCPVPKALKTKVHQEGEYLRGDRWVRVAVHPVLDKAGTLTGAVSILFDITARRRAEDAFRESEERYRLALDALPDPVFVKDEQHRWTILNDAACRFMGHKREKVLGRSDFDVFPREEAEVFWAKDDEVFASGKENVNEENLTDSGGQRHVISTKKSVYRDSRTGRQILVGVIRDVTEAKRASEELDRYREHLEDIVRERTKEVAATNERMMREAEERARAEELQAAIYEISEAANQAESLEQLFISIHSIVGRLMNAKNFYIALHDPTTNLISFPYFVDEKDTTPPPFPLGPGMTSYVIRSGQPLLGTPGVLSELEERGEAKRLGADSIDWLGVPLKVQDKIIGVVAVQTYVGNVRYTEADKEVLSYVSAQVAEAIQRKRAGEALRESEETARVLLNAPRDVALLVDTVGRVLAVNANAAREIGTTAEAITGRSLYDHLEPEVAAIRRARIEETVRSGKAVQWEDQRRGVPFANTAYPIFDAQGRVARVAIFAQDITDERRLREVQAAIYAISEATQTTGNLDDLYRSIHAIIGRLMNAKNFYIALHDRTTNLISFPYFVDEKDTTPPPFQFGPGMTSYVIRSGRPLLGTPGVLSELEARGEAKRLGADSIDWLGVPLKVQDRVIGVLAVQSYVGNVRYTAADQEVLSYVSAQVAQAIERKRAEEALRESEERYRTIFQRAPVGVLHYDNGLRITDCNDRYVNILKSNRERLLGLDMNTLTDKRVVLALCEPLRGGLGEYDGPYHVTTGAATPFVSIRTAPLHRQDGAIVGGIAIVADMTEHKRLEDQLRQSQKMEVVGNLAGGVAHDFNNLLQAMLNHAQLLLRQSGDAEKVLAVARELEEQINRGASLTRQLLLFSRRETVKPERLDLNDVVREATQMLQRLVRENIALAIELAPEALLVEADRGQLQQVLLNLTLNASDAMSEGGRLLVRTDAADGNEVRLSVADTGHGIPDAIRDRIFEPFFTTKEPGRGTGLGLSVVHGIVTGHGGRIEVQSEVEKGSTITVILPKAASAELAAVQPVPRPLPEVAPGKGERILVVEDEAGVRDGLRDILASLGYDVAAAGSGEEAKKLSEGRPFDLLLTDLMLPGAMGPQVAYELQERWPALKVILMSGYTEDETVRRGVTAGNVRFLQKPFNMEVLAREVRAALDEV